MHLQLCSRFKVPPVLNRIWKSWREQNFAHNIFRHLNDHTYWNWMAKWQSARNTCLWGLLSESMKTILRLPLRYVLQTLPISLRKESYQLEQDSLIVCSQGIYFAGSSLQTNNMEVIKVHGCRVNVKISIRKTIKLCAGITFAVKFFRFGTVSNLLNILLTDLQSAVGEMVHSCFSHTVQCWNKATSTIQVEKTALTGLSPQIYTMLK